MLEVDDRSRIFCCHRQVTCSETSDDGVPDPEHGE